MLICGSGCERLHSSIIGTNGYVEWYSTEDFELSELFDCIDIKNRILATFRL